jgi:hypothetical protein
MALELHQRPGRGRRRSIRKAVVVVGVGYECAADSPPGAGGGARTDWPRSVSELTSFIGRIGFTGGAGWRKARPDHARQRVSSRRCSDIMARLRYRGPYNHSLREIKTP